MPTVLSTARSIRRRLTVAATIAVLAPLALIGGGAVRADTAPPNPNDPKTPVTVSADALPTAQINGVGWKQTILNGTVYVVGDFSSARPAGAALGSQEVPRQNIMAYDLQTGELKPGFNPSLNAEARAITASPDGSRLYVGGSFTSVDGVTSNRIAALDPQTGARISSFKVNADASVRAIAVRGSTVWIGGVFSRVNGQPRSRLAAVSAADGSLLPWAPQANGRVNALAVAPDGTKVAIGGAFTSLNGSSNPGFGLGAVTHDTGATLPFPANTVIRNAGANAAINSLSSDGTLLYGTAFSFNFADGNFEGMFAARWTDLGIAFMEDCHGDTYDAAASDNAVYTVGHSHSCNGVGGFPETGTHLRGVAFTKQATQVLRPEPTGSPYGNFGGQPAPSLLAWFPRLDTGTYTGQDQGPWSVAATNKYVVMAGEFPTVNGKPQQGLVRYGVTSIAPNKQGPRVSGADFTPTVTPGAGSARITWRANHDRDNQLLTYKVYRDSTVVSTQSQLSTFWSQPTMSFDDTGVPKGQHTYKVKVIDPFGNAITSPVVTVTVP